jgi:hypothetical protein
MLAHRFKVGQRVTLAAKQYRKAGGAFEIVRQMPPANGNFQYRIKSASEGHERMAFESELY